MENNNKASIFIYILLLVSIALILWLVVFNNSITLTNNLNIWKNSEEVFNNLSDKAEVTIDTVRKYNTNWDWWTDDISCPTNVTMSGSSVMSVGISTSMVNVYWSIYCLWNYTWTWWISREFRIFFNEARNDYESAYYEWDLVKLNFEITSGDPTLWNTNVAKDLPVSTTVLDSFRSWDKDKSDDEDIDTEYKSKKKKNYKSSLVWTFDAWDKYIWKVIIKKRDSTDWKHWDRAYIKMFNSAGSLIYTPKEIVWANDWVWDWWNEVSHVETNWVRRWRWWWGHWVQEDEIVVDYIYYTYNIWKTAGTSEKVHKVELITENNKKYLDLFEIEMYEYTNVWSWTSKWIWEREFNDTDTTLISFDTQWTGWDDGIDDNLNSDDYKVTSTWSVYYANGYQDDDVIPRKIIFWNVPVNTDLYNIFWNNYKTVDFIENNINNVDNINIKLGQVGSWTLYLDLYTLWKYNYDLKILEFNRDDYKNKYTLLPIATSIWYNLSDFVWYIQKSSTWTLSLSRYKTWNEYEFDFSVKDYWIYISNHDSENLSYRISWEVLTSNIADTWSGIYINPIDDSGTWTISVMSNHMIIGWEKNFIWENFIVTEAK